MEFLAASAFSLAYNFIPLVGVVFYSWDAMYVIQVYVIEHYILVLFDYLRMRRAPLGDNIYINKSSNPRLMSMLPLVMMGIAPVILISVMPMVSDHIKFLPWRNFWPIASLLTVQYSIHYFSDIYSKRSSLTMDEIAAHGPCRVAIIMAIALLGSFCDDSRNLVFIMVFVKFSLNLWQVMDQRKRIAARQV